MGRLLQFGTVLLMLVTLLVPVSEYFDRWDAAGLTNDTEFALFCIVMLLCLVLVAARLVAARASRMWLASLALPPVAGLLRSLVPEAVEPRPIPPLASPPLRI